MSYHQDLRIFVFTTSFPRFKGDDAGVFVQRLVAALAKLGVHETVFVPRDQEESPLEVSDGLEIKRFRYTWPGPGRLAFGAGIMPNLRSNPWLLRQAPGLLLSFLFLALRNERCHVVHANWLLTAIPASLYALVRGVPFVVTARGEDVKLLRKSWARTVLALPLRIASSVIAVSNSVADDLRASAPQLTGKISVIPNGIEIQSPPEDEVLRFRSERNLPKGVPYILFVGSIIPHKRIDLLIEIMRRLEDPRVVLLLCGRLDSLEYVQSLQSAVRNHGLEGRIRFEGAIPTHHVPALLSFASLYITASEHEGRPNSLLEAMASGLPVLASDIPAHREIIDHERTGILFASADTGADAVDRLLRQSDFARALGERGKESIDHLSWHRSAEAYRELFSSLRHRSKASAESKDEMH